MPGPTSAIVDEVSGFPHPESRRSWQVQAWMPKRSQLRVSGGHEGRSERPATGCGDPETGLDEYALRPNRGDVRPEGLTYW